jgi:hypothetical protein
MQTEGCEIFMNEVEFENDIMEKKFKFTNWMKHTFKNEERTKLILETLYAHL